jgi:hypothetical protein
VNNPYATLDIADEHELSDERPLSALDYQPMRYGQALASMTMGDLRRVTQVQGIASMSRPLAVFDRVMKTTISDFPATRLNLTLDPLAGLPPGWSIPSRDAVATIFDDLAEQWIADTTYQSSLVRIFNHPIYQQIIGLGPAAIPRLLERLVTEPDRWLIALSAITRTDPVPEGATPKEAVEVWLSWAEQNDLLSS